LKTDAWAAGRSFTLPIQIQGAPNFRTSNPPSLKIYGCGSPTVFGIKSILTALGSDSKKPVTDLKNTLGHRSSNPSISSKDELITRGNFRSVTPVTASISTSLNRVASPDPTTSSSSLSKAPNQQSSEQKSFWFCTREEPIIYISGQPFVLRDLEKPSVVMGISARAESLEAVEDRLKNDVLRESAKYGGLFVRFSSVRKN
jgi:hypothetical protein